MRSVIRLTLLVVLVLAVPPARAAVLTVTKTADTLDGACDSDCSLREAVTAANSDPGADTIVLSPGVYALTRTGRMEDQSITGDLDVSSALAIQGAGADRTVIDAGGNERILDVQDTSLELRGVTVRNGEVGGPNWTGEHLGGAIRSRGRLTVTDCVVSDSRAQYGGGIYAFDLILRNSTVTGNVAFYGGGLYTIGSLEMENATLAGNKADEGGGAKLVASDAGLRILHTTIAGNQATAYAGGIFYDEYCIPEVPCPPEPRLRIDLSIVAGNTAPQFSDCLYLDHAGSHNVFGVGDDCNPVEGDRAGTPQAPLDPKLAAAAGQGGTTPTRLPLAGSPAIDLAPAGLCSGLDQRGAARPVDGDGDGVSGCDAGAVEAGSACQAGGEELCLGDGDRFRVTARWTTKDGSGAARSLPLTRDTGAFWFFNSANLEIVLKVLDGCAVNDRFWVFLTGLTNVGVEVTVRDTVTGRIWTDVHPAGTALPPRLDTDAFDVCGEGS
ncbi:MAG TPA: choice-of-anchor Q domain-containing protein [Thermoanaerobaculia bacterium]|nr:choice-of-anchor Q domain-containing protein [Thermoanaerobaculia bacterium]